MILLKLDDEKLLKNWRKKLLCWYISCEFSVEVCKPESTTKHTMNMTEKKW